MKGSLLPIRVDARCDTQSPLRTINATKATDHNPAKWTYLSVTRPHAPGLGPTSSTLHRGMLFCSGRLAPCLLGLLLSTTGSTTVDAATTEAAATAPSAIFGSWSLAPAETSQSDAQAQAARRAKGIKPSRKERKRAKKRATQRASIIPDILKTPSLQIRRKDATHIALIPHKGDRLVVQTNGQSPSLSLSEWGKNTPQKVGFSTWEEDSLVIETTPRQGLHIIHSYRVNDRGLLVQSIELYDGLDAHSQRRLFKHAPEPVKPTPASTKP